MKGNGMALDSGPLTGHRTSLRSGRFTRQGLAGAGFQKRADAHDAIPVQLGAELKTFRAEPK
jgi:hypothetical protein